MAQLVAYLVWDQDVGGSSPPTPTDFLHACLGMTSLSQKVASRYSQASANSWGAILDPWMLTVLKNLTAKASRVRVPKLRITDDAYEKGSGYYRSQLSGENEKGYFNLNLHLELTEGSVKFTAELHQGQKLDRLTEVWAGPEDPAIRMFESALLKAVKTLI